MPFSFFTILSSVGTGLQIVDSTKKIQSKIEMIFDFLKRGKLKIVILGPGGVGKSTLAKYLSKNESNPQYVESTKDEKIPLGKNIIGYYWVAPGQKGKMERYWPTIYREISQGKIKGVINVVAYGYHSVDNRLNYKDLGDYYTDGMSKDDFLSVYLEKRREEELNIINEIKHRLKDTKEKVHMITLVTKQDLWWQEKEKVQDFYMKGVYNTAIEEIIKSKGTANFEHTYFSVSFLANNFHIANDVFKLVSEGYDENIRIANMNTFIKQLEAFIN